MLPNVSIDSTPLLFATTWTQFGDGIVAELPDTLNRFGIDAPLFITDEGVENSGILDRVIEPVNKSATIHYATQEPSADDFEHFGGENTDGIVAIGGGSCIDTAKLMSVLLSNGGSIESYIGVDTVPGPTAPLIAVPTTSGTGSQATQTAVVKYDGVKRGVSDESLRPDAALVDPTLTFDLPQSVTRSAGFDAFVHAFESLTARDYRWVDQRPIAYQGANPISRTLAMRALALIYSSLEQAVHDGHNYEARRKLSLGSHLAGAAFTVSGLGSVHALASAVGGLRDQPHGECLATSLEPGLRYNLPVRRTEYAEIARWLGVSNAANDQIAASDLIDEWQRIRDAIGLPGSIKEFGFTADDIDSLVENTLVQERRLVTNPRRVTADIKSILSAELD